MALKKTASFWNKEIIRSSRAEKEWRVEGNKILKKYRNESTKEQSFNILFSNTQTIKPSIYSATPKPDVRNRWKNNNEVARDVATVMEKALSFAIDAYDFDASIEAAVDDMLLPGRGTVRVRYIPSIEEVTETREEIGLDENGEETVTETEETLERIADQQVICEYVYWEDFRIGPVRNWIDGPPWIAFRHKFTKQQFLEEEFENFDADDIGKVDFSFSIEDTDDKNTKGKNDNNLAVVWEIWDIETRKVYWITSGIRKVLEVNDDPLELQAFFPVPSPLYAVDTTSTMVPVPLYEIYKTLAEELNTVQSRIIALTNGLKLRGIYPNNMEEIQGMLQLGDNKMLGVKDFVAFEGRKISDFIMFAPITEIAQVISGLTQQRESIKLVIFEVTGISDILRGTTKASETLGAQKIKAQFGATRLENLLKQVRVFARDLIRMKAEIIADKFTPEILQMMTGEEITPEMEELMRSDVLRNFNIDIETDSTVAIDRSGEKQEAVELLQGITTFMTGIAPLVQVPTNPAGVIPMDTVKDLLLFAMRSAGAPKAVEEAIERIGEQPPAPPQGQGQGPPQQLPPQGVAPIA